MARKKKTTSTALAIPSKAGAETQGVIKAAGLTTAGTERKSRKEAAQRGATTRRQKKNMSEDERKVFDSTRKYTKTSEEQKRYKDRQAAGYSNF